MPCFPKIHCLVINVGRWCPHSHWRHCGQSKQPVLVRSDSGVLHYESGDLSMINHSRAGFWLEYNRTLVCVTTEEARAHLLLASSDRKLRRCDNQEIEEQKCTLPTVGNRLETRARQCESLAHSTKRYSRQIPKMSVYSLSQPTSTSSQNLPT